jgi:regulatory protein
VNYDEALFKSAAYCSLSERCTADLNSKFDLWEVSLSDRKKILNHLIQEKYLNESRYARSFVQDKFRYNKWGRIKISHALRAKSIGSEMIQESLNTINEEEYQEMIIRLAKEKSKSLKFKSEYEKTGKLLRYLAGKGFETGIVQKVLKTDRD